MLAELRATIQIVGASNIASSFEGRVAERFKAPVLKTDVLQSTGGSNPSSPVTTETLAQLG